MDKIAKKLEKFAEENFSDQLDKKQLTDEKQSLLNQTSEMVLDDLKDYGVDDLELIDSKFNDIEEDKEQQIELQLESPRYKGSIIATLKKVEDNAVKLIAYDDKDIRDSYGVENFLVVIPDKGRYMTEAVDEKVAVDRAIVAAYAPGELQDLIFKRQLPDLKASILKEGEGNVQRMPVPTEQPKAEEPTVGESVVVVHEEYIPSKPPQAEVVEKAPGWAQPAIDEMERELDEDYDENIKSSIDNQTIELIQNEITDLDIPAEVEEVKYKIEDGKINGSFNATSEKFHGAFAFTGAIDDHNVVSDVEPELEPLKGMYGLKEIEVDINGDIYKLDAIDEVTAVKKVLSSLIEKDEDLVYEGKTIMSYEIDEIANDLAETQTKVVNVYQSPESTELGVSYQLVEEDGKKYLKKKD